MNYEEKLKNVSVLGAAGKMGSGILLLTAVEMAELYFKSGQKTGSFILNAIDVSPDSFPGLHEYLKSQITKIAEKKIVQLRDYYKSNKSLAENAEIICQYVDDVIKLVLFSTRIESAYDSTTIFEAIIEDPEVKTKVLRQIRQNNIHDPWFLTNTSSVPISELDKGAGLNGKIIGFHFYNPPAVQKLVELITTDNTDKDLAGFAKQYGANLKKRIVPANDTPGFIGNGHFIRDLLFGIGMVDRLSKKLSFAGSVYAINRVSQDFLIRPMGIFQLMDYVGIDVCQKILQVMRARLSDESLQSPLIDKLISFGIKGGQNSDGSQSPGILMYEKNIPVSIYDPYRGQYIQIDSFRSEVDTHLGNLPYSWKPWKEVIKMKENELFLRQYFSDLIISDSFGSELAREYHLNSKKIGLDLLKSGVADNIENVNTVMQTGFFHAYGPVNDYIN